MRGATGSTLEAAWKNGQLKDPIEAVIMAEEIHDQAFSRVFSWPNFWVPLVAMTGFVLILVLAGFVIQRYFPAYNFCWGDYLESFERKEARRKFITRGDCSRCPHLVRRQYSGKSAPPNSLGPGTLRFTA